jgi:hypothetical protein
MIYAAWNSFMKGNGTTSGLKTYRDQPFPKLLEKRIPISAVKKTDIGNVRTLKTV